MIRFALTLTLTACFFPAILLAQPALEVYSIDPFSLIKVKESLRSSKSPFMPAYKKLIRDAEKALDVDPVSVVDKDAVPPSGNKHDYMSLSRYWWPDPTKPDGLPYMRRDGETNPETAKYPDHENFVTMAQAVSTLGLAYFYSGMPAYARHAGKLARAWFLDSATAMNPNLQYAQAVPGRSDGRGPGVLDGRHTAVVIDAVNMIRGSEGWTDADDAALRAWFGKYVDWLTTSVNGIHEGKAANNHGTWHDAHVVPAALYSGKRDIALRIIQEVPEKRIGGQIEADGSQPKELARTRPWHYSWFNLQAYARLAVQAKRLGVDLWRAKGPDGQSLKTAVEFLLPYLKKERVWSYPDLDKIDPLHLAPGLIELAAVSGEASYLDLSRSFAGSRLTPRREFLTTGIDPNWKP